MLLSCRAGKRQRVKCHPACYLAFTLSNLLRFDGDSDDLRIQGNVGRRIQRGNMPPLVEISLLEKRRRDKRSSLKMVVLIRVLILLRGSTLVNQNAH